MAKHDDVLCEYSHCYIRATHDDVNLCEYIMATYDQCCAQNEENIT